MRVAVIALVGVGCGRIGFDSTGSAASIDAPIPFVEPVGMLDPTFGSGGYVVSGGTMGLFAPHAVVRRGNGGYLVVGLHVNGTNNRFGLIALTAAGQADTTFGGDGLIDVGPTANDFAYGAKRIDANHILLAGDGDDASGTLDDFTLGIIDEAGTPSPTFGASGFVRVDMRGTMRGDTANRAIVVDGTHVIACGNNGYETADSKVALVKLDLAGNRAMGFGTNGEVVDDYAASGYDECSDIAEQGSNVIVVGEGDGALFSVAAYRKATGARDTIFATAGLFTISANNSAGRAVTIVDGDIVAGGRRNARGLVARLGADGTRRTSFGTNGEVSITELDLVQAIAAQPNGKIIACGTSGNNTAILARLNTNGTRDMTFGTNGLLELDLGGNVEVRAMELDPDGHIVIVAIRGNMGVTARVR